MDLIRKSLHADHYVDLCNTLLGRDKRSDRNTLYLGTSSRRLKLTLTDGLTGYKVYLEYSSAITIRYDLQATWQGKSSRTVEECFFFRDTSTGKSSRWGSKVLKE